MRRNLFFFFYRFVLLLISIIFFVRCQSSEIRQILVPVTKAKIIFYPKNQEDTILITVKDKSLVNQIANNYFLEEESIACTACKSTGEIDFHYKNTLILKVYFNLSPENRYYQYRYQGMEYTNKMSKEGIEFLHLVYQYRYVPQNPD